MRCALLCLVLCLLLVAGCGKNDAGTRVDARADYDSQAAELARLEERRERTVNEYERERKKLESDYKEWFQSEGDALVVLRRIGEHAEADERQDELGKEALRRSEQMNTDQKLLDAKHAAALAAIDAEIKIARVAVEAARSERDK